MARPEKWDDDFLRQAKEACEMGATDKDLANLFGVSDRTIYYWQTTKPEFAAVLKVAKQVADDRVERSLYHRAVGYTFDSVKIFPPRMTEDGPSEPIVVPYVEHVPPDTTACIFWLKNRQGKHWRDKNHVEHSGTVTLESLITGSDENK